MPQQRGDGPVSTALAWRVGLLGIWVSGDLGPWTIYTDRYHRVKWFLYSPPTKPPTQKQIAHRSRFVAAQAAWAALSDEEKATLETAVKRASLCLTGQNLYISACLTHRGDSYRTVGRQTRLNLPPLADV